MNMIKNIKSFNLFENVLTKDDTKSKVGKIVDQLLSFIKENGYRANKYNENNTIIITSGLSNKKPFDYKLRRYIYNMIKEIMKNGFYLSNIKFITPENKKSGIYSDLLSIKNMLGFEITFEKMGKNSLKFNYLKNFYENTSATGGPSGGMGVVVSGQPSGLAGQNIGPGWASNGGTDGSGDVGVPLNPGGSNRVRQDMGDMYGHSKRRAKKAKAQLKQLVKNRKEFEKGFESDETSENPRKRKVMDFSDFQKDEINKVNKVSH